MRSKLTKIILAAGLMIALAFTFCCSSDDGEDSGGKGDNIANYNFKKIGDQFWMTENLDYKLAGSVCYGGSSSNCKKYGRLYNWTTAMALPDSCKSRKCDSLISEKHQGICPSGWHIPSEDEWDTLLDVVGGSSTAGTKLKAKSNLWNGDGKGKDTYSFSALPGGFGESDGKFYDVGDYGYWWSANETSSYGAYYRYMAYDGEGTYQMNDDKNKLFSVRCLQN